jgi:hypothetical protein
VTETGGPLGVGLLVVRFASVRNFELLQQIVLEELTVEVETQ